MDREVLFFTEVFIKAVEEFFGWTIPKSKEQEMVGVLEADLAKKEEISDWVAEAQVEWGKN